VRQRRRCEAPSKEQDYHKTRLSSRYCYRHQHNLRAHRCLGVRVSPSTCPTSDGQSSLAMDMRHSCLFMIEEIRVCVLYSWVCKNADITSVSTIIFLGTSRELLAAWHPTDLLKRRETGSERETNSETRKKLHDDTPNSLL
jgi:hypothetical protein